MAHPTQRLRTIILGAGLIGAVHRRAALLAGAEVVGVMASSPARSAEAARDWGCAGLSGLADLAALAPDAVHVCTPNALHAEQVEAALDAGAHVICEKPLAIDVATAAHLRDLVAQRGRVATVPYVYRFHPLVREIRARAQAGAFGPWQLLHGSYLQDWMLSQEATSWRVDPLLGGPSRAFADIGSHWCDLMEFVTGERITAVCAAMTITQAARPAPSGGGTIKVATEDAAVVSFRCASGVLGSVTVSQVSAGRKNRLWFEFDGETRSAVFDQEAPETVWLGGADSVEILHRDPALGSAEQRRLSTLPPGHPQGFAQCFENFVADTYATAAGQPRDGLPTFEDGLRSAHLIEAVARSAAEERWVSVAG